MLESQERDVDAARCLARFEAGKAGVGGHGQRRVDGADRLAGLAPAGGHHLGDLRVLEQDPEQLAGSKSGGANHGHPHQPFGPEKATATVTAHRGDAENAKNAAKSSPAAAAAPTPRSILW